MLSLVLGHSPPHPLPSPATAWARPSPWAAATSGAPSAAATRSPSRPPARPAASSAAPPRSTTATTTAVRPRGGGKDAQCLHRALLLSSAAVAAAQVTARIWGMSLTPPHPHPPTRQASRRWRRTRPLTSPAAAARAAAAGDVKGLVLRHLRDAWRVGGWGWGGVRDMPHMRAVTCAAATAAEERRRARCRHCASFPPPRGRTAVVVAVVLRGGAALLAAGLAGGREGLRVAAADGAPLVAAAQGEGRAHAVAGDGRG